MLAAEAEAGLARAGAELFGRVFAGADGAGIWALARDRLGEVRVEVDADPVRGRGWRGSCCVIRGEDAAVALGGVAAAAVIGAFAGDSAGGDAVGPAGFAVDLPGQAIPACGVGEDLV